MSVLIALALSLTGATNIAPPVAPVPVPQSFKDWTASCDNGRDCQLFASSSDGAQDYWFVHVTRKADAAAVPIVSIGPRFDGIDAPVRVVIDSQGRAFSFDAQGFLNTDAVPFLRAMARGFEAKVLDESGQLVARLPTSGASAALRWIDDAQEREGTVTALIARGDRPQNAVPAPPNLPTITPPPRSDKPARKLDETAIAAIKEADQCASEGRWEVEFHRLDDAHSLGLIPCNFGAYQGWSLAVVIDENGIWSPAMNEQSRDWSQQYGTDLPWLTWAITTAHFAPEKRMLSEFSKGRGLADCGTASSWVWDGAMFRLASHNAMDECRGASPDAWPVLWRTTNASGLGGG